MTAAPVQVTRRVTLPVGDIAVTVLLAEGAGQIVLHRPGADRLAGAALVNAFLQPGMGDELRALATEVDAALAVLGEGDGK